MVLHILKFTFKGETFSFRCCYCRFIISLLCQHGSVLKVYIPIDLLKCAVVKCAIICLPICHVHDLASFHTKIILMHKKIAFAGTLKYSFCSDVPGRTHSGVLKAMVEAVQKKEPVFGIKGPSTLIKLRGFDLVWACLLTTCTASWKV